MQKHTILISKITSATTAVNFVTNSKFQLSNGYYSNLEGTRDGSIVDEYNVRGYLNDDANEFVITQFFVYLTATTSPVDFREIFYSDIKLSQTFNQFYNDIYVRADNTQPTLDYTSEQINTPVSSNTYYNYSLYTNNYFLWSQSTSQTKYLSYIPLEVFGDVRDTTPKEYYESYSLEDSFYIPVFINRTTSQIPRVDSNELSCSVGLVKTEIGQYYGENEYIKSVNQNVDYYGRGFASESKKIPYSYVYNIITYMINKGYVLTGSIALSKQGTVYRSSSTDIDFVVPVDNEVRGADSLGVDTNENIGNIPKNVYDIINYYKSQIKYISKIFAASVFQEELYRIHFYNGLKMDLFVRNGFDKIKQYNGIEKFRNILKNKSDIFDREKDYYDLLNFVPYDVPKQLSSDSFIKEPLLQCFVNRNTGADMGETWATPEMRKVKIEKKVYNTAEGVPENVNIFLDGPAYGCERFEIKRRNITTVDSDYYFGSAGVVIFEEGQQSYSFPIKSLMDQYEESSETFIFYLDNLENLGYGPVSAATVVISDNTRLNRISFVQGDGIAFSAGGENYYKYKVTEGQSTLNLQIRLNGTPNGYEKFKIRIENQTGTEFTDYELKDFSGKISNMSQPYDNVSVSWSAAWSNEINFFIEAKEDFLPEGVEYLNIKLVNLEGVKTDATQDVISVRVFIYNTAQYEYANINLCPFKYFSDGGTYASPSLHQYSEPYFGSIVNISPKYAEIERVEFLGVFIRDEYNYFYDNNYKGISAFNYRDDVITLTPAVGCNRYITTSERLETANRPERVELKKLIVTIYNLGDIDGVIKSGAEEYPISVGGVVDVTNPDEIIKLSTNSNFVNGRYTKAKYNISFNDGRENNIDGFLMGCFRNQLSSQITTSLNKSVVFEGEAKDYCVQTRLKDVNKYLTVGGSNSSLPQFHPGDIGVMGIWTVYQHGFVNYNTQTGRPDTAPRGTIDKFEIVDKDNSYYIQGDWLNGGWPYTNVSGGGGNAIIPYSALTN